MQIKPFTMSVLVGSSACQALCPFCVSKMTTPLGVGIKLQPINYNNFNQACLLAKQSGVTTILLTGKGEPTLFPDQISEVLEKLSEFKFPIIELQTNAISIYQSFHMMHFWDKNYLKDWFNNGLRVISISNVGIDPELNRKIYLPNSKNYIDLKQTIEYIQSYGFSVRLATMMIKGGVDNTYKLDALIRFAKQNNVAQLKVNPIEVPKNMVGNEEISAWTKANRIADGDLKSIIDYVKDNGTLLLTLPHGASVYDLCGQNICLSNCLTESQSPDTIRQLIYFPDGSLRYSWQYEGARIL